MANGQWRPVSLDEARRKELYGFRGSLIVVYAITILLAVWQVAGSLIRSGGLIEMYGSAENADIMRSVMQIKALCWVPFFVLAPACRPQAYPAALISLAATWLMDTVVINFVLVPDVPVAISMNLFNIVVAGGLTAYFLRSERINLTYRLRERRH